MRGRSKRTVPIENAGDLSALPETLGIDSSAFVRTELVDMTLAVLLVAVTQASQRADEARVKQLSGLGTWPAASGKGLNRLTRLFGAARELGSKRGEASKTDAAPLFDVVNGKSGPSKHDQSALLRLRTGVAIGLEPPPTPITVGEAPRLALLRWVKAYAPWLLTVSAPLSSSAATTPEKVTSAPTGLDPTLPPAPSLFVGRAEQREQLVEWLTRADRPTVTMHAVRGIAGIGKSALAIHLANDPAVRDLFGGAVFWLPLGVDGELLVDAELARIGELLGDTSLAMEGTFSRLSARLTALLRGRRSLVIVDDAWSEDPLEQIRRGLGSDATLLVTTRSPTVASIASAAMAVPVLSEEDANALLRALAPALTFEHPAASRTLVASLGFHPLAIQVAARSLAREVAVGLDPRRLLDELVSALPIVDARTTSTSDATEKTVRAVLARGRARMSSATAAAIPALAKLPPKPATIALEHFAAVFAKDDPRPILRELVEQGLLEPAGGERFMMHPLVRAFAASST